MEMGTGKEMGMGMGKQYKGTEMNIEGLADEVLLFSTL